MHEKLFFTFMHLHSYVSVHPFFCFFCFAYIFVLPYKEDNTHQVVVNFFCLFLYLNYDPFFLDGFSIPLHIKFFFNKTWFLKTPKTFFVFVSLIVEKTTTSAQLIIVLFLKLDFWKKEDDNELHTCHRLFLCMYICL